MRRNFLLFTGICLISLITIASSPLMDSLAGSWVFTVEQTMPEYSTGKLVFEETGDNDYTGKIVLKNGREISMSSVSVEADTVTFKAYVEGSLVTTVCTWEENKLNGFAHTPDGSLPFSATKEK